MEGDEGVQKCQLPCLECTFHSEFDLNKNGYPNALIDRKVKNNMFKRQDRNPSSKKQDKNTDTYLRLPYINETVVRRVNRILRRSGTPLKVAWTSGPSLSQKLITSAFTQPSCPAGQRHCHTCESGLKGKCTKKNVFYKIICNMCETNSRTELYIGESTHPIRYRFNEHLSDARLRKPDTPLGEHVSDVHFHATNIEINSAFRIEIIGSGRDCAEIKIAESIQIRKHKPTLNVMRSSWPLVQGSSSEP